MPNDKSQQALVFTVVKKGSHEWFVEPSNKNRMGPYHSATVALHLAAVEALLARKRGWEAQIFVQDDYGTAHLCHALDKPDQASKPSRSATAINSRRRKHIISTHLYPWHSRTGGGAVRRINCGQMRRGKRTRLCSAVSVDSI